MITWRGAFLDMLNQPKFSPYGNAIPGLEELGIDSEKNDERTVPMALDCP